MIIKSSPELAEKSHLAEVILQSLNNFVNQGMFITDVNLTIYGWNHWLEIHTGKTAEEMLGKNLLDAYPDLRERNLTRFYNQALEGQIIILSQRFHRYLLPMRVFNNHHENTPMWQTARIGPLLSQGQCIGTLTLIDDVTERVEREAQFQQQIIELENTQKNLRKIADENLRLAMAINSASEGVMITDTQQPQQKIIYVNPAFTEITGYLPEEVTGHNCDFLQGEETDQQSLEQINQAISEKISTVVNIKHYRRNKQPFWNELKISPIFAEDGNLLYFLWILNDVTERQKIEAKISEQAALLNIATDAILVEDLNNRILFWNQGAERIYGFSYQEVVGKKTTDFIYKIITIEFVEARLSVIQTGEWSGELQQINKEGKKIIVESRWTLVKDEKNQAKSILIVNTDLTRKKQLELQFLRTQRLESIGTLAGGIAHDLNNMLTPILGGAQLLQLGMTPEQNQHWLKIIENNARRGADLVKQVLSFARGIEGDRSPIQLKHLIWEVGNIAKQTFPKYIDVIMDICSNLWIVCGDVTQLNQVLMNLCINARDAMLKGGTLTISAKNVTIDEEFLQTNIEATIGNYVLIEVMDTGIGISPENVERIFEPFFTTKAIGQGTGLGLSTVLGIVKSHHGFITVDSKIDIETKFQVYLPAVESLENMQLPRQKLPLGDGELILVVDDETDILLIMETILENYGYKIISTNSGHEAIAIYQRKRNQISLVIIDLMMPLMDGITTIGELRKINPQIKIITTSGLDEQEKMEECRQMGIDKFLPKPYTAEQILKSIYEVINNT
jgi:two-component system, cell cycle sensor histidine kinase and response regulator CckA